MGRGGGLSGGALCVSVCLCVCLTVQTAPLPAVIASTWSTARRMLGRQRAQPGSHHQFKLQNVLCGPLFPGGSCPAPLGHPTSHLFPKPLHTHTRKDPTASAPDVSCLIPKLIPVPRASASGNFPWLSSSWQFHLSGCTKCLAGYIIL